MTEDDLRLQRQLIDDGVIQLWRWLDQLGVDNMTRADVELWYALTRHSSIMKRLWERLEGTEYDD